MCSSKWRQRIRRRFTRTRLYDTKENQAWLRNTALENGILKKGAHHIKLTAEDVEANRQKGLCAATLSGFLAS